MNTHSPTPGSYRSSIDSGPSGLFVGGSGVDGRGVGGRVFADTVVGDVTFVVSDGAEFGQEGDVVLR